MVLYITHISFIEEIDSSLDSELAKGGQMLLLYDRQAFSLSEKILDYISTDKIKIKKLPDTLEKSLPLVAYELERQRGLNPDGQYILWGGSPFQELYRMLIQYDSNISCHVTCKNIKKVNTTGGKPKPDSKTDSRNANVSKDKKTPQKRPRKQEPPYIENDNSTGSVPRKNDKKELVVKQRGGFAQYESSFLDFEDDLFQDKDSPKDPGASKSEVTGKADKTGSPKEKCGVDTSSSIHKDLKTKEKPEISESTEKPKGEEVKEDKKTKAYEKMVLTFQDLLEDICKEPVNETNATSIMMALTYSLNSSNISIAQELYRKKLTEFMNTKKAHYFYSKTINRYEEMLNYIKN